MPNLFLHPLKTVKMIKLIIIAKGGAIASPPCHCERDHEEPVRRSKLVAFTCMLRVCFVVPPRNDNKFYYSSPA